MRRYPFGVPLAALARDELPEEIAALERERDEAQLAKLEEWLAEQWRDRGRKGGHDGT